MDHVGICLPTFRVPGKASNHPTNLLRLETWGKWALVYFGFGKLGRWSQLPSLQMKSHVAWGMGPRI